MQNSVTEVAVYNTAIYVRLSKEDMVAAQSGRESNSITNQKQLILDYLKDKPEFNIVSIHIDDGYTGTNFDRPKLTFNRLQVSFEITQLFSNGFAGHFDGVFAASCVFQVIFPGTLAVSPGLHPICGIMESIQKLLCVFSGLIEQRNVLGITNIGRRAGGVYNHSAAVAASSRTVIRVIVILVLDFF